MKQKKEGLVLIEKICSEVKIIYDSLEMLI